MARIIWGLIACAIALVGTPAAAQQDATGYWVGTLELTADVTLRVGVDITLADDGTLAGTLDSPDQNAFGIPLSQIAQDGTGLSFVVPAINAAYQGRWNNALSAWEGNFIQAGQSWALVLTAGEPAARPEPVALPAEWTTPDNATLHALLDKRIAGRPGAIVVLGVSDDQGTRIVASGPENGTSNAGDTMFEIGSMTKVFTALLLADMTLKGELSLDDPVAQYLPEGAAMPSRDGKDITLRNLTMQDSGLPRLPDNMPYGDVEDPYADYTEAMLLEFLAGYELSRDIGSQYEYSNLGVGVLGYALARAAGTDYETLVRTRILDPLGMRDTAITLSPSQEARFATPHDQYMRPTKPWNLPTIAGAGALRSTARDMLIFLAAALDPQSPIGPAIALTLSDRLGAGGGPQTALGWILLHPPSGEVLHHGGGTGGFRTHMAVQPTTGRAVVVLTNAAVEPSAQDLALHVLFGAPTANEIPVPSAPPPVPVREEVTLEAAQLDHVAGTYRLAPGVELIVEREGAGVTALLTGQPAFPIYPSSPLEFFWRVVDARVVFSEEDGAVTAATLFQNGREIPMVKINE